jgi:hypothetical protein
MSINVSNFRLFPLLSWSLLIFSATLAHGTECSFSIWENATIPTNANFSDPNGVELGVRFKSNIDGYIKGIRFYKGFDNIGTHIGNLWTSTGQLLATAVFTNETSTGWQQVDFTAPVPITADIDYIASYYAPNGYYAAENFFFKDSGLANAPLMLPKNTSINGNGVFAYNTETSFPNSSYLASNYWVDVEFISFPCASFQTSPLPKGYTWGSLDVGKQVYIDRPYEYTSIPSSYSGQKYILTANDDKTSTGDAFLYFHVNLNVTVYVAHDTTISTKPTWLADWIDTEETLVTNDTTLSLFSKDFTAGSVTLGGNEGLGQSMYTVVVVPFSNTNEGASIPIANQDSISMDIDIDTSVNINVLANDSGLADTPVIVSLVNHPSHGLAVRNDVTTISYTPNAGFSGQDGFHYLVTDQDGDVGLTMVTVQVTCASCPTDQLVTLSWNHSNPSSVDGYKVFAGPIEQDSIEIVDVSMMELADPEAPSVNFQSKTDLGLNNGDTVCFRVQAYNAYGVSPFSSTVCSEI